VLAGETGETLLTSWPTSFGVGCGGIVAVDPLRHALMRSDDARANVLYGDADDDDPFCNALRHILEADTKARTALITAIEEEIDETGDPDGALAQLLDTVASTPVWAYALNDPALAADAGARLRHNGAAALRNPARVAAAGAAPDRRRPLARVGGAARPLRRALSELPRRKPSRAFDEFSMTA
jgi:hypothetical protein